MAGTSSSTGHGIHPDWCVETTPQYGLSAETTIPGLPLTVWAVHTAGVDGTITVVVDGPNGAQEITVQL